MSISGIVGRTVAAGSILAALGANAGCAAGGVYRNDGLIRHEHPLAGKVGFAADGALSDGTKVHYDISLRFVVHRIYSNDLIVERVEVRRQGESCPLPTYLEDYDHDGEVDFVWLCNPRTELKRDLKMDRNVVMYDKRVFLEQTAYEVMRDADRVFAEAKRVLNVEALLKNYSTLERNPLK